MEKSLNKVSKPKNWLNIICQDNLNEEKIIFKYGFIFFNLGIFFLAAEPFFGTIFILISIFFFVSRLMLSSALLHWKPLEYPSIRNHFAHRFNSSLSKFYFLHQLLSRYIMVK